MNLPVVCALPLDRSSVGADADLYIGNALLATALERAIAADPSLGLAPNPSAHDAGTCTGPGRDTCAPPPRVLIYRPDADTRSAVRLRDQHCRFPGCRVPAARCQIDHVVAYNHADPKAGGWTVTNNLQCLCAFHHQLKTDGSFTATMLAGGVILWVSNAGTTIATLPATGHQHPLIEEELRPHIPTKRRTGLVAYPGAASTPDDRPPPF